MKHGRKGRSKEKKEKNSRRTEVESTLFLLLDPIHPPLYPLSSPHPVLCLLD